MISDVALQNEDFTRAYDINQGIVQAVRKLNADGESGGAHAQEAKEACWVACFQLGRQSEFPDVQKKLFLLGVALEFCPPERMVDILVAWGRLDQEDVDARWQSATTRSTTTRKRASVQTPSLVDRLQIAPSSLVHAPDAAMFASSAIHRVAANFLTGGALPSSPASPFTGKSQNQSRTRQDEERAHASRVLQKGIGWLIGADDN